MNFSMRLNCKHNKWSLLIIRGPSKMPSNFDFIAELMQILCLSQHFAIKTKMNSIKTLVLCADFLKTMLNRHKEKTRFNTFTRYLLRMETNPLARNANDKEWRDQKPIKRSCAQFWHSHWTRIAYLIRCRYSLFICMCVGNGHTLFVRYAIVYMYLRTLIIEWIMLFLTVVS